MMPHDGGESRYVYRMLNERDWMDAAEAGALAAVLAAFWSAGRLPRRLERTLWASEHVAWERYVDVILPTLVAALEGMLNTSARQVTRQFTTRVPALAADLGWSWTSASVYAAGCTTRGLKEPTGTTLICCSLKLAEIRRFESSPGSKRSCVTLFAAGSRNQCSEPFRKRRNRP